MRDSAATLTPSEPTSAFLQTEPAPPEPTDPPIRSRWPIYGEDEIEEVLAVLRSGRVNALHHGERCKRLEERFAQRCGRSHAIAVANGTVALELALRALGIGPGDDVIVPARSFIATASCVAAVGARPIFADVDPITQNLSAETILPALTDATRAVIVVHLAGWPAPMDEIVALAEALGLKIVEDCAQAHGAMLRGRPAGGFGDAAAFSFCTDKIISTGGEGGLLVLKDEAPWARAWAFKDHGKHPSAMAGGAPDGTFRWLHSSLGSNYRLTELQAAIGLRQLAKLPHWVKIRGENAQRLNDRLADLVAVRRTLPPRDTLHAYYKYYAFVRPERLQRGWSRDRILASLIKAGVPAGSGICPEIYREHAFLSSVSVPPSRLPVAAMLGETSLMLPCDPTLDTRAIDRMGDLVAEVLAQATN
nr:DegT/DnrJ/EryC1/StrS aminotransferase family protein [uncultured Sphingomonas sp.]